MSGGMSNWSRRGVLKKSAIATGAFIVGGSTLTGTAAADIGDGRVAHYPLNNLNYDRERGEIVAGHVHDASPENNHGEWHDADKDPVVKDGAVGNAYKFDGVNDFISVADDDSLRISDELTLAFWFFLDGEAAINQWTRPVSKGQTTTSDGGHGVYLKDTSDPTAIGLRFMDEDGNQVDVDYRDFDPYDDGEWHHVAVSYSNSNDRGRLYFDGDEIVENEISGDVRIRETDDPFRAGFGLGNSERPFNGKLDEVRVYNRELSASDVEELVDMADD